MPDEVAILFLEYDIKSLFGRNNNFNNQNYKMIRINNFETKNNDKTSITRNDNYYVKSSFDGRMGYESIFKSGIDPKYIQILCLPRPPLKIVSIYTTG